MNPLVNPEDRCEATELINRYAESDWCGFSYSEHAQQRMEQRIVPIDVITGALQKGKVVGVKSEVTKRGVKRWKYEVEMVDAYGRVTVITAIPGRFKLHIVSVYTDIPD